MGKYNIVIDNAVGIRIGDNMKREGIDFLPPAGMTLAQYQTAARQTRQFPPDAAIIYPAIGLANEGGELLGLVKKGIRVGGLHAPLIARHEIIREMGDVLWYLAALADDLGIPLDVVAEENLAKLRERQSKNDIKSFKHADEERV